MIDETAPGPTTPEFRCLARAGLDGANTAMLNQCQRMTPNQRRAASNTAADLLIGQLG